MGAGENILLLLVNNVWFIVMKVCNEAMKTRFGQEMNMPPAQEAMSFLYSFYPSTLIIPTLTLLTLVLFGLHLTLYLFLPFKKKFLNPFFLMCFALPLFTLSLFHNTPTHFYILSSLPIACLQICLHVVRANMLASVK